MAVRRAQSEDKPVKNASIAVWGLVVLSLAFAYAALFGERGMVQAYHAYQQKLSLQQQAAILRQERDALRQEITLLRDPAGAYIEQMARTELGMVRQNELVFQFPSTP